MADETPKFDELVIEEEERELSDVYEGGSESEAEESVGTVSDFKALLKELNPQLKDPRLNELVKTARVSRIFPDNFLDKFGVSAAMLVMEKDTSTPFQFIDIINQLQDGLSFGYEGRGISDLLEAYGAVKQEELDKLSKDLGI